MYRVVVDPGVFVSAAVSPAGAPAELIRRWRAGAFELIACPLFLKELETVLLRKKFRRYLTEQEVPEFVAPVRHLAILKADPQFEPGLTPDPKDDYLMALGREHTAAFVVSGDSHLLDFAGSTPPVIKPAGFLELL